jgi:hypothetical protein
VKLVDDLPGERVPTPLIGTKLTFPTSLFEFSCPTLNEFSLEESWTDVLSPSANLSSILAQSHSGSGFFLDAISNNHGTEQTVLFGSFYQSQAMIRNCVARLNTRDVTVKLGKFKEGWPTGPGVPWGLIGMGLPTYSNSTPLLKTTYFSALFNLWNILDPVQPNISSITEHYLSSGVVSVSTTLANLSIHT